MEQERRLQPFCNLRWGLLTEVEGWPEEIWRHLSESFSPWLFASLLFTGLGLLVNGLSVGSPMERSHKEWMQDRKKHQAHCTAHQRHGCLAASASVWITWHKALVVAEKTELESQWSLAPQFPPPHTFMETNSLGRKKVYVVTLIISWATILCQVLYQCFILSNNSFNSLMF